MLRLSESARIWESHQHILVIKISSWVSQAKIFEKLFIKFKKFIRFLISFVIFSLLSFSRRTNFRKMRLIFVLFICLFLTFGNTKKYNLCNFVNEILVQGVLRNDLFKHVCIVSEKSNFRTDYNGTNEFGIYAIHQSWFKDCNVTESIKFMDENIDNDIECAEKILQRNGSVKAWGEEISCNHLRPTLDQCFDWRNEFSTETRMS